MRLPADVVPHPAGLNESEITQLIDAGLLAKRLIRRTEYDAILSFITGTEPERVASRMREAGRTVMVLTPQHRMLPGHDMLELRISAVDGAISGQRRSQSISGRDGTRIVDRESLESAVPPEATMAFAQALESEQLWSLVNRSLDDAKPGPPVEE
jgi:hypothetical protein